MIKIEITVSTVGIGEDIPNVESNNNEENRIQSSMNRHVHYLNNLSNDVLSDVLLQIVPGKSVL